MCLYVCERGRERERAHTHADSRVDVSTALAGPGGPAYRLEQNINWIWISTGEEYPLEKDIDLRRMSN